MGIKETLDGIVAFEKQINEAEAVSGKLGGLDDPQYVPAVLAMLERNAEEDDFGIFGAFGHYLEQFEADRAVDGTTVGALIAASVKRAPMWKTCELLPGFSAPNDSTRIFVELSAEPGLSERARECVTSSLKDAISMSEDDLDPSVLAAARAAVASASP